jgi:hypothetical protein
LTSVHIPRDQIGQIICDSLLPGEKTMLDHDIVIDPELVVRDSTGPAAGSRNAEVGGGAAQPANVSQHRPS